MDDATLFAIFDEVNTMDIWTARLAAKKGHSKEVRELGKTVATDHEGVQQMTRDIAKKSQIVPTPPDNDKNAHDHASIWLYWWKWAPRQKRSGRLGVNRICYNISALFS